MGYLKPRVRRVTLPSDPTYWVEIEAGTTYGERKALYATVASLKDANDPNPYETAGVQHLIDRIKAWNLTDEKDQALPVSMESFLLIDVDDASFLASEAAQIVGGGQDNAPFSKKSGSGSRRKAQPTTA